MKSMREQLIELTQVLDPDVRIVVAEVVALERDYLDMLKPRGVKEDIRDIIDRESKRIIAEDRQV